MKLLNSFLDKLTIRGCGLDHPKNPNEEVLDTCETDNQPWAVHASTPTKPKGTYTPIKDTCTYPFQIFNDVLGETIGLFWVPARSEDQTGTKHVQVPFGVKAIWFYANSVWTQSYYFLKYTNLFQNLNVEEKSITHMMTSWCSEHFLYIHSNLDLLWLIFIFPHTK